MKDKEIRNILLEYIKTKTQEVRIYQEKSIGSSICDVMAATDRLTGYEIKSDADDYTRLHTQMVAYDEVFDENYVVVSKSHAEGVKEYVPKHWGILCILEDNITVLRDAKANPRVQRKKQLMILWKLELKNILVRNDLPMYAQKEKGYIADRIIESVSHKELRSQIAYELLHRDYSLYEAEDYTVHGESAVKGVADMELIDTLSEQDLSTLTLDQWIAVYRRAKKAQEKKNALFQRRAENRTVHAIPFADIEISLGVPWISESIISEFANHLLGRNNYQTPLVTYTPLTGYWYVDNKKTAPTLENPNATVRFGTKRYNALQILEATLNLREIRVMDSYSQKLNEPETLAALNKQKVIQEEFKKWLPLDEDRVWSVEDAYNKLFSFKKIDVDGRHLTFPEMSEKMSLFPYQKDAVERIMTTPNTLLAFDVGAGKTYIMVAAAMKMRQDGISRKNLFVVPNHIVGQWEKIFTDLYPKAKLLTVEPKSFKPVMRSKVLHQMKTGDYDGIIIAYSCFDMIPVSRSIILDTMDENLREVEEALKQARKRYGYNDLDNERMRIRALVDKFLASMQDQPPDSITFDQLEINTLFLDEAHNYKNLPLNTRMKNLRGINVQGSRKCLDMMYKIRAVQEANQGRGVVLATGTPLCNSIADTYVMQMYLQPRAMKYRHFDRFDNWVKTFAQPEQTCEIDVDASKFRFVNRFVRFFNLPELSAMFAQIAIFHAADEDTDLPVLEGYTDIAVPRNPVLIDYMKSLTDRTEAIRSGKVLPSQDNMLKVSTDGRKAALSLTLVGKEQKYDEFSKVRCCVQEVLKIYRGFDQCSQLIFCDYSTPKPSEFCVYAELREHLISEGIPEKEIAFIHSYKSESTRLKLFEDVNAGRVRVLIGSTFKLGIGANVQTRLKAIHHLDVPWRPADMVQREGRIIRRGNENENVRIFRYVAKGSFDSYCWQVLENKQRFISQFLSGSAYERSAPDLEANILTYAEVKALALSQPAMKRLAEIENDIRNEKIVLMKEQENRDRLAREKVDLEHDIEWAEAKITNFSTLLAPIMFLSADQWKGMKKDLTAYLKTEKMNGETFEKPLELFEHVRDTTVNMRIAEKTKMTVFLDVYTNLNNFGTCQMMKMGPSAMGNAQRVINYLKRMPENIKDMEKELAGLQERIEKVKAELERGDQKENNLLRLQEERDRLVQSMADSGQILKMKQ